jgi:hypothetical protein
MVKLYFLKLINLFGIFVESDFFVFLIVGMFPIYVRQNIIDEIKRIDKLGSDIEDVQKRKMVANYMLNTLFINLDYDWLDFILEKLTPEQKKHLSYAIIEVIFFGLKNVKCDVYTNS